MIRKMILWGTIIFIAPLCAMTDGDRRLIDLDENLKRINIQTGVQITAVCLGNECKNIEMKSEIFTSEDVCKRILLQFDWLYKSGVNNVTCIHSTDVKVSNVSSKEFWIERKKQETLANQQKIAMEQQERDQNNKWKIETAFIDSVFKGNELRIQRFADEFMNSLLNGNISDKKKFFETYKIKSKNGVEARNNVGLVAIIDSLNDNVCGASNLIFVIIYSKDHLTDDNDDYPVFRLLEASVDMDKYNASCKEKIANLNPSNYLFEKIQNSFGEFNAKTQDDLNEAQNLRESRYFAERDSIERVNNRNADSIFEDERQKSKNDLNFSRAINKIYNEAMGWLISNLDNNKVEFDAQFVKELNSETVMVKRYRNSFKLIGYPKFNVSGCSPSDEFVFEYTMTKKNRSPQQNVRYPKCFNP